MPSTLTVGGYTIDEPDAPEPAVVHVGGGYPDWTVAQLRSELRARELPVSGNKAELAARLAADDEGGE